MKKIRRIIVGMEPAPRNRAVLEAAARLAERMEAELVGLFVENINLLHFAGMPFACETGFASATKRDLDVERMERTLRGLAREAHQSLAAVAGRIPVRWSFRVARGSVVAELLAAAAESDLVVANIERPGELNEAVPVRIVHAGDPGALRAALEAGDGILVLAGADAAVVGDTLRELLEQEWT
jgi:K+-sensing histidine kinase KdpD